MSNYQNAEALLASLQRLPSGQRRVRLQELWKDADFERRLAEGRIEKARLIIESWDWRLYSATDRVRQIEEAKRVLAA